MLPHRVEQYKQRVDSLLSKMDSEVESAELWVQGIFASQLVLAGSGYIEEAVSGILSEYGRSRSNPKIARFVDKSVARVGSLNCRKIEELLQKFNKEWWPSVKCKATPEEIAAVDSLKALRDQVAHGKSSGTGYTVVRGYYIGSKRFVNCLADVVNK